MISLCVSQLYQNILEKKKIFFINTLSPDIFWKYVYSPSCRGLDEKINPSPVSLWKILSCHWQLVGAEHMNGNN